MKNNKNLNLKQYPFFNQLIKVNDYEKYLSVLDWFLEDKDFNNVDNTKRNEYFDMLCKILNFVLGENYFINVKDDEFCKNSNKILFQDGKQKDKLVSFIKHIRNCIAHARIKIRTIKKVKYIEAFDYDNNLNKQTAYILMPLEYLLEIHNFLIKKCKKCK